jgi:hypothetical protein
MYPPKPYIAGQFALLEQAAADPKEIIVGKIDQDGGDQSAVMTIGLG